MTKREPDSFHAVFFLTAIFSIMAVLIFVFTFSAKSVILSKELLNQKIEVRAVACLEEAGHTLTDIINEKAHSAAENKYYSFRTELTSDGISSISEKEALDAYREMYIESLRNSLSSELLSGALESRYVPQKGSIEIDQENKPELFVNYDENTGDISSLTLDNLVLKYSYGSSYERKRSYNFEIEVPHGIFFDGNDELFDYSMISQKGIYITGNTSSIVGNVFAGTHSAEEYRKAESGYGERKIYGGINIMSTQLGIEADKIISTGEINLKGAFAVFGTEEKPITIYSGDVNELTGFFMRTSYNLLGNIRPRGGAEYEEAVRLVNFSKGKIDGFSLYYDSDNDEAYSGKYRKIISGTDVNLTGDFTGVVITSGNVIIEADSNIEGFIYAGDRIYIQGNNNIVSNRDILREMVIDEKNSTDENRSVNISEYLGGLEQSGLDALSESMVKINP